MIKQLFKRHWLKLLGVLVGAAGGYLYYYYVGCVSGSCPITSNPYRMMIYGALMGYLLFELFSNNRPSKKTMEIPTNNNINRKR